MADDLDELVLKVGVQVDAEQLKKLRAEIDEMQKKSKSSAQKLGLSTSESPMQGPTKEGGLTGYGDEILDVLSNSQKTLLKMLDIMKTDNTRKTRTTDEDEKESKDKGPIPFMNNVMDSNAGSLAGGAIGGVVGTIAGGNTLAGAQIGSAIGGLMQKMFGVAKEKVEAVAEMFDKQVTENMHFRQLSEQTGMTVTNLYKLQQQALFAGTTLEKVADSNQRFVSDMMGGISPERAQLLMALNINPSDLLFKAGGDPAKANQMLFKAVNEATKGQPAYQRSYFLSMAGYDPEMQTARRHMYSKAYSDRAQKITDEATNNGKNPIPTGAALDTQILLEKGMIADFQASIRKALTAGNLAQNLSVELMHIKAETVNLIADTINSFGKGEGERLRVNKQTDQRINTLNQTVNENESQRTRNMQQLHQGSGAAKSGVPK